MAKLVSDHVSLAELARRAQAIGQLVEEAQVDIDLLVRRAIKRTGSRLGGAAGRCRVVAEQNQFCVTIRNPCPRQDLLPSLLNVVQDKRDELDFFILPGVTAATSDAAAGAVGRGDRLSGRRRSGVKQRITKDKAEQDQQQEAAQTYMPAAKTGASENGATETAGTTEPEAAPALAAAIFDVRTFSTRCPTH